MPADASAGGGGASGFDGSGTSAAADGDIGAGELLFAVELVALAPQTSPRHRSIDSSSSEGAVSAAALAAVVACPAPPASLTAVPSTRRWLDIMVRQHAPFFISLSLSLSPSLSLYKYLFFSQHASDDFRGACIR
jgi:hypothetical protein